MINSINSFVSEATGKYIDEVEIIANGSELGYLEDLAFREISEEPEGAFE